MKLAGRPITMLTAYDAVMAELADAGSVDVILVGDSAGTVVHGFETTLPITLDMMIVHTQAVVRGARRALIVTDLPFLSYQVSLEQALESGGRVMKEGGADAVKLEVFHERVLPAMRALTETGIPVMGHVGFVPQSVHQLSGYRVQGRTSTDADRLVDLARKVEDAGAFAIVVELVPDEVGERISRAVQIPVIGIGAGPRCDGQVLVINDLLGLTAKPPSFARKYIDLRAGVLRAVRKYTRDVRERVFPPGPPDIVVPESDEVEHAP
jgi:3-methyl-2-oxobutanoate hydroxymethyltransferase